MLAKKLNIDTLKALKKKIIKDTQTRADEGYATLFYRLYLSKELHENFMSFLKDEGFTIESYTQDNTMREYLISW